MKAILNILLLLTINLLNSQVRESDYFTLYKGGEKYLKPIKYIFFDNNDSLFSKKKNLDKIYFYYDKQTFIFDNKMAKDTILLSKIDNKMVKNPEDLKNQAFLFFKNKKEEVEKKNNLKINYPASDFYPYFKIYIIEKTDSKKALRYEVEWKYSSF